MKDFRDRVAAITGAGSGIGRALALQLAADGCHLSLSDVDAEGLAETVRQLGAPRVKVTTATVDVADRAQVEAWATQTVADLERVHMIFNNAGVALGGTVEGTTIEEYEWIVGINFWGVVYGTKAFLPHLRAAGEGHVINISSIFGLFSQPTQSLRCFFGVPIEVSARLLCILAGLRGRRQPAPAPRGALPCRSAPQQADRRGIRIRGIAHYWLHNCEMKHISVAYGQSSLWNWFVNCP